MLQFEKFQFDKSTTQFSTNNFLFWLSLRPARKNILLIPLILSKKILESIHLPSF